MAGLRKRVLWVDDEIELLRAHIMFLETRGYNIVPVFSGHDAIALIEKEGNSFDLVLLDEQMPGMNGLVALEQIKALRSDLPVVMVTKSEEEDLMDQAIGKKIDGYLTKPVNPSQILLVCKRILESKQLIVADIRHRYLRFHSETATKLKSRLLAAEWIRLHEQFSLWDRELDSIDDEAIRQAHAGQKSETNKLFSEYVTDRYSGWIKRENKPPTLATDIVPTFVVPELLENRKVCFIVMDGMRYDQYFYLEAMAKKSFMVSRQSYLSILPTDSRFTIPSILGGIVPLDFPQEVLSLENEPLSLATLAALTESHLTRLGEKKSSKVACNLLDALYEEGFSAKTLFPGSTKVSVVVTDSASSVAHENSLLTLAREIAPDEKALRALTATWLDNSPLAKLFQCLGKLKATVIITSAHGVVLCRRSSEVYGTKNMTTGLRYTFGQGMTADERHTVLLHNPNHFNIPQLYPNEACAIAREDYSLVSPKSFKSLVNRTRNIFQYGGISMDEMILPLGVCRPL